MMTSINNEMEDDNMKPGNSREPSNRASLSAVPCFACNSPSSSGSRGSPSSRSGTATVTLANENTFARLNHLEIHGDDAVSPQDVTDGKKKKRGQRAVGGDKSGRGLRQFSMKVCEKVESKGRTTYNEVADELVAEFSDPSSNLGSTDQQQYDEKNIRRRVYDALNVLMAMDIISKDKKEIQWKGLPRTSLNDIEELKAECIGLGNRIEKKAAYLRELQEQYLGLQNLIERNERLYNEGSAPSGGVALPFLLVQTRPNATVEVEISEDMQLVHFDFNSTPFELHDDSYVVKAMRQSEMQHEDGNEPTSNEGKSGETSNALGTHQNRIVQSAMPNSTGNVCFVRGLVGHAPDKAWCNAKRCDENNVRSILYNNYGYNLKDIIQLGKMEVKNRHAEGVPDLAIEIRDACAGSSRQTGNKICGGASCGFSDVGSSTKDAKERQISMRKLMLAVVLCIIFMSVEVYGGIQANSLAILTDAAHLLSDVAAFAISLFSLWASGWEATPRQSYGFFRIEILGALVSIQLIWLLTGILVYQAIDRLLHESGEVEGYLMFAVAAFGFVVNIAMALMLGHDHDHGGLNSGHGHANVHGHGHAVHGHDNHHDITITTSHHHAGHSKHKDEDSHEPLLKHHEDADHVEYENSKKQRDINVQGAYLHVLGDSIQSVGVMIGGAIIWYKPEWKIIDLICTLIFSVIVLGTTFTMLTNILEVLMESTPREIDATRLEKGLCDMDDVVAVHELHIWAITVGKVLLACHVTITPEADAELVLDKVIGYIKREYNISHVTIQIERA